MGTGPTNSYVIVALVTHHNVYRSRFYTTRNRTSGQVPRVYRGHGRVGPPGEAEGSMGSEGVGGRFVCE